MNKVEYGDCLAVMLRWLEQGVKVQMCVTSPPYWGLRDYGVDGQMGMESTPELYVAKMVEVFRLVREMLADDGTLWLNLGDSYNAYNGGAGSSSSLSRGAQTTQRPQLQSGYGLKFKGLKPKDLIGIPWRVALALQADGWYLRQDVIWHKPNPMPESVRDRFTKSHEYLFLFAKNERYYFDHAASRELAVKGAAGSNFHTGKTGEHQLGRSSSKPRAKGNARTFRGGDAYTKGQSFDNDAAVQRESHGNIPNESGMRNRRSVWVISTKPFKGAHFATFPPELITPCILAGSRPNDIVLDPFMGSGTTAQVALQLQRQYLGCELNPAYAELIEKRVQGVKR